MGTYRTFPLKPSAALRFLAREFPPAFRRLIALSVQGYLPSTITKYWALRSIACDLFREEGLPIYRSPYRLHVPPDELPLYIDWHGYLDYEPMTRRALLSALKPGYVMVDVGAAMGYYTLLAAWAVGRSGRVHAVEPWPANVRLLEQNVRTNGLQHVTIHPYAAGAVHGSQAVHLTPVGVGGFDPIWPPNMAPKGTQADVQVVPLDDVLDSPIHVVKIDVDGFELDVLRGMTRLLAENPDLTLLIEWAPVMIARAGRDPLDLPTWLQTSGFTDITVCDECDKRRCELDEIAQRLQALPRSWYSTLLARRH